MPKVLNKHKDSIPSDAVYIGRPSKWGNPFVIGHFGNTREGVIVLYRNYLTRNSRLRIEAKAELRNKDLVCFCSPLACHGDILLKIANED